MSDLFRLIWYALIGLFRSRVALEAEILVLRHQLNVLRRKSPKRVSFRSIDRLHQRRPLVPDVAHGFPDRPRLQFDAVKLTQHRLQLVRRQEDYATLLPSRFDIQRA